MGVHEPDVTLSVEDGIAVITIDNPPINAGSHAVRTKLVDRLIEAADKKVSGAVLIGAGRVFIAGSDLKEFGQALASPELPDVIRAVEMAPFPVVAAMHGVALGGGYELALGCDYRVAAPGTKVGLPEVSLGMLPGAGGTQRLPRLVGQARAIDLICEAKRIDAEEAKAIGAIDDVIEGDLLAGAKLFLGTRKHHKRRIIEEPLPAEDAGKIETSARIAIQRGNGRPNVAEAVRLIRLAGNGDPIGNLAEERASFQRLRLEPDALALRYLFFAERQAGIVDNLKRTDGRKVARVGIVGGGTMGQGIAKAALAADLPVLLVERDRVALDKALTSIAASFDLAVAKGWLDADLAVQRKNLLRGDTAIAAMADRDLAIEAVFEDMDVKRSVLAELEAVLASDALVATNTSYLDIEVMSEHLEHPERVLGLHFFSPADRMPLLEIVRTRRTSDETLASGLAFARKLKKQPVVTRVAEGFIGNRIYAAYRRRAELFILDGATPADVDDAIRGFGFRMGPFEVADLSGLDIAWAMRKRLAATRDPADRYVTIPDRLCEAGRLGRKAGKGWYDYVDRGPRPSPEVEEIISDERRAAGVNPRSFDRETIQRQLLIAMVNEAACLIVEGVAQRISDIDVVLANGYGFPRWRGGPVYWAAQEDSNAIEADLVVLAEAVGHGFRRGPVRSVVAQLRERQGRQS